MKINLGNKILNIKLNIFNEPNLKRLSEELSDYFNSHEVEGMKIEEFKVQRELLSYKIIPVEPYFEECLSEGEYIKHLENIGKKYGVEDLGFAPFCYHK